ncbi:MAG: RnfH family protein, partial [Pseudomonadales bacterium]|nr:RnfH family protein [Pseudomonadales bacterium]
MDVEVAYATPAKQKIIALKVAAGCTAYDAAQRSGIVAEFAEIDLQTAKMGVFG